MVGAGTSGSEADAQAGQPLPSAELPDLADQTVSGPTANTGAQVTPSENRRDLPRQPLFLERQTYRRRRVMDAARLLPMFGAALLLVPVFWGPEHRTSAGLVYLFLVWLAVIVMAFVLSRRLAEPLRSPEHRWTGDRQP